MTIGSLSAVPFIAYLAQVWAATGLSAPGVEFLTILTVEATAIILVIGLYAIWRLVHRQIRPIEDLLRVRKRKRLSKLVRKAYGHKYSQLLGASLCAAACMSLVIASSWPDIRFGFVIAMGELTFFAPNSMYWALRLAQFTRKLAASTLRLGRPDPRDNFAIQRLGAVVAGAIGLVGIEAFLTVLTIILLANSQAGQRPYGWQAVVLLGVLAIVLLAMAFVAFNFAASLLALRIRVLTELRSQIELRQDELDNLPSDPANPNARNNRRKKLRKKLNKLRAPRRGLRDRWFQLALVLLGLPIATIANIVSANWSTLTP
jgi:HAMP domain-containing protein